MVSLDRLQVYTKNFHFVLDIDRVEGVNESENTEVAVINIECYGPGVQRSVLTSQWRNETGWSPINEGVANFKGHSFLVLSELSYVAHIQLLLGTKEELYEENLQKNGTAILSIFEVVSQLQEGVEEVPLTIPVPSEEFPEATIYGSIMIITNEMLAAPDWPEALIMALVYARKENKKRQRPYDEQEGIPRTSKKMKLEDKETEEKIALLGSERAARAEGDRKEPGKWEEREYVRQDGKLKLKTQVFFASIDQGSERAKGNAACSVLAVFNSHWLITNPGLMPTAPELDILITEGSSRWQELRQEEDIKLKYPNGFLDIDVVVERQLRPIAIDTDKGKIAAFNPEKFDLQESYTSFDNAWSEVVSQAKDEEVAYIVGWNEHFFVLKIESDACYLIDTLGHNLNERCHQAYILKFDSSSRLVEMAGEEETEVVSEGRNCCRDFIKRFWAEKIVTAKEVEAAEAVADGKEILPNLGKSIGSKLQIEFHCIKLKKDSSKSSDN